MKTLSEFFSFLLAEDRSVPTEQFSLEKLRGLKTLTEIDDYIESTLKHLGRGVGRTTWIVDKTKIVKLARGHDDTWQNKREIGHAECLGEKYAPIIFDFDRRNYFWILEERLQPVTGETLFEKLQSLMGYRFKSWMELKQFFADNISEPDLYGQNPLFDELYNKSQWFRTLVDELRGCQVSSHDFHDENWGIRPSTGELVLLDLGV